MKIFDFYFTDMGYARSHTTTVALTAFRKAEAMAKKQLLTEMKCYFTF
jgi:hypothetical protein